MADTKHDIQELIDTIDYLRGLTKKPPREYSQFEPRRAIAAMLEDAGVLESDSALKETPEHLMAGQIAQLTRNLSMAFGITDSVNVEQALQEHVDRAAARVQANEVEETITALSKDCDAEKAQQLARDVMEESGLGRALSEGDINTGEDLVVVLEQMPDPHAIDTDTRIAIAETVFGENAPELDVVEECHQQQITRIAPVA